MNVFCSNFVCKRFRQHFGGTFFFYRVPFEYGMVSRTRGSGISRLLRHVKASAYHSGCEVSLVYLPGVERPRAASIRSRIIYQGAVVPQSILTLPTKTKKMKQILQKKIQMLRITIILNAHQIQGALSLPQSIVTLSTKISLPRSFSQKSTKEKHGMR